MRESEPEGAGADSPTASQPRTSVVVPPARRGSSRRGPRWRGPLLVLMAMVVAFAIGAFIGSRTELFPPQVEGDTPASAAAAIDPEVARQRWIGSMMSTSSQEYGEGPCTTDWRSSLDLTVSPSGEVRGTGRARLVGRPRCPFKVAQLQIQGYDFELRGTYDQGTGFLLSPLRFAGIEGNFDHGGFALTLAGSDRALEVPLVGVDRAQGRVEMRAVSPEGRLIRSRNVVRLACPACAGP